MDLISGLIAIIHEMEANSGGNYCNKAFLLSFQIVVHGCPFSAPKRFASTCQKQTADRKKGVLPCASAWVIGLWQ